MKKKKKRGFESWFCKKIPGKERNKKAFLVLLIVLMFGISYSFFDAALGDTGNKENFTARVLNTKINN